ncbi:MAG: DNRLRE domain-containing protein [Methanomassiliicoccales archaeon]
MICDAIIISLFCSGIVLKPASGVSYSEIKIWAEWDDTYIFELQKGQHYEMEDYLKVGNYTEFEFPGRYCSLIHFDISVLPADSEILFASLNLYKLDGIDDVKLYLISEFWEGATTTWQNQPDLYLSEPYTPLIWDIGHLTGAIGKNITSWVRAWFNEQASMNGIYIEPYPYNIVRESGTRFYSYQGASVTDGNYTPYIYVRYRSSSPIQQPPPPQPPPWRDDVTPPQVSIEVIPSEDIRPTDTVSVTVSAIDDICLYRVQLFIQGVMEEEMLVPYEETNITNLGITYESEFSYGEVYLMAVAMDKRTNTQATQKNIYIGSRTPPTLQLYVNLERVFPNDDSQIEITVIADDPEGIVSITVGAGAGYYSPELYPEYGEILEFTDPFPTHVAQKIIVRNLNIPWPSGTPLPDAVNTKLIRCMASTVDVEHLSSDVVTEEIQVIRPYQWDYGIPYHNPGNERLGWERMVDVFGRGELRGPGDQDWWWTILAQLWKKVFELMCEPGECFGMSSLSIWHYDHRVPIPDNLTAHTGDQHWPYRPGYIDNEYQNLSNYARRFIQAHQGSQISQELLSLYAAQIKKQLQSGNLRSFVNNELRQLVRDVKYGTPGILCVAEYRGLDEGIMECIGAHAVVPWYVEEHPGWWKIYVYDSNRPYASVILATDYYNYSNYPYIILDENGFSWIHEGGELWNDFIWYVPYSVTNLTDYDLIDGWLVAGTILTSIFVGAVAITLTHLLPIPLPIPMQANPYGGIQGMILPSDRVIDLVVNDTGQAEYTFIMNAGRSVYGISNKSIGHDRGDNIRIDVGSNQYGLGLRLKSGVQDEDFSMGIGHRLDLVEREYILENISMQMEGDIEILATENCMGLCIRNYGNSEISCKVILRSSESETVGEEELTIAPGEEIIVTGDWTSLGDGLSITRGKITTGEFPTVLIFIGAVIAVTAVALLIFIRRRK